MNTTSHPDLFFAIRGGGSNFGVVTKFVFKLYPQRPTVYCGLLYFTPSTLEKIVNVTKEWWANVGEDEAIQQLALISRDRNVHFQFMPPITHSIEMISTARHCPLAVVQRLRSRRESQP